MAGQEGLEPPASGFGDRRSTNWSYWPVTLFELAGLFMYRMTLTPLAVLLELDALRIVLLVLLSGVISTLAIRASECHQSSHWSS